MKKIGMTIPVFALLLACGTSSPGGVAGNGSGTGASASSGSSGGSSGGSGSSAGTSSSGGGVGSGSSSGSGGSGSPSGSGSPGGSGSPSGSGSPGGSGSSGGAGDGGSGSPTAVQVAAWAAAYKAAHPGNGGKDWDIVSCCAGASRTEASLLADAAAMQLRSICGPDELPLIPTLAWEYGGVDHQWINPQAAAVAYCVYTPKNPATSHWKFDAATMRITADVYVRFPDQNPCKAQTGANQVMACLGDPTNIEVFVDIASFHDGADVGLSLANASTDMMLILPDGSKVLMYHGP